MGEGGKEGGRRLEDGRIDRKRVEERESVCWCVCVCVCVWWRMTGGCDWCQAVIGVWVTTRSHDKHIAQGLYSQPKSPCRHTCGGLYKSSGEMGYHLSLLV